MWGRWTATGKLSPRRRRRLRFLETKTLCLQAVVVALNWITLGHAHSPPECGRTGFPMSSQQHEMLERLEDLVDYFLSAPTAPLESLGRSGEKLAQLAKQAFLMHSPSRIDLSFVDIHSFLDFIQASFDPYTHKHRKASGHGYTAASHPGEDSCRKEEQPVRITSLGSTAKPVVADRIKWKLAPAFDPGPFLSDPIVRRAYVDPDVLRRPPDDWPKLARAKVHASREEVLRLASKWDALRACRLVPCSRVNPHEAVGIFAVPKDAEYDRLILNPTVINSRCYPYSAYTKTIAPGYLMALVRLDDHERLVVSSDDLCEFYYTFTVSQKRAKRNAIGVKFWGRELEHLQCYRPEWHDQQVYICLATLAMGDALAVEIAQQSHVNLLRQLAAAMRPRECLQYRQPVPRGPFYELLTIDDHIGLQKLRKDGRSFPGCDRDTEVFEASNAAYNQVGLTAHPGKKRRREPRAVVLGAEIDGDRGRVSAPRERVALLSFITCIVIAKGLITRELLQGLIGCWTHVILFRRPLFSLLDAAYHEGEHMPRNAVFTMSQQCSHELLMLCILAPIIQTDMRTSFATELFMMDASPYGGGICRARFSAAGMEELWRHTEQRGYYTKLQQGANLALHELGLDHTEMFGGPSDASDKLRFSPLESEPLQLAEFGKSIDAPLRDTTVAFDCIELFSGQGNWSRQHEAVGLRVHPGIERDATGLAYGDLSDNDTFRVLAKLAYMRSVRDWHAGPPCWSFGTLRRPRLRSKLRPAGFDPRDPRTAEQTSLALRTALILLTLALLAGSYISCEQPGGSVMFELHAFRGLLQLGCQITKFCFCSFGSAFMKPSKWLHNKPWYSSLAGRCTCRFKGKHFTVQGTFTRQTVRLFNSRCNPSSLTVYGREPRVGEAVSKYSASYPIGLCKAMAAGAKGWLRSPSMTKPWSAVDQRVEDCDRVTRDWFEDPAWVEDICESLSFRELFRFRFRRGGHINCLECRVYKTWLKHCSKQHPRSRVVGLLDSRVTMGASAKGRSSSYALSRVLKTSLGYILGGCLYPGTIHCRSEWNRADGPSRDKAAPGPTRPVPRWLEELQKGNTALFDTEVELAKWSRPVGRWIRLLLLLAGDIEPHPGPVGRGEYVPRGELNLLGGFSTATSARMKTCLEAFQNWCTNVVGLPFEDILGSAETANLALRGYGLELFRLGKPRYLLVYAITALQQLRPEFRRQLAGAWQVDAKWQLEEPGQCRAVLPAPLFRAALVVSLLWGWHCFAGMLVLGFGGMLHPNEYLNLSRRDLVFPEDAMLQQEVLFIYIKNPKTARFARRQHVKLDDASLLMFLRCLYFDWALDARLFPASPAVFRRQWNALFDHLGIPRRQTERGVTPGVLRGSGATHSYIENEGIPAIQWRGRWSRLKTLEYYIQEVAAQLFLFDLDDSVRRRISMLEGELATVLHFVFPSFFSAQQKSRVGK